MHALPSTRAVTIDRVYLHMLSLQELSINLVSAPFVATLNENLHFSAGV